MKSNKQDENKTPETPDDASSRSTAVRRSLADCKTFVKLKNNDSRYNEYTKGEIGYIDGYCRGGDDVPYCVVVIGSKIVMCIYSELEVINPPNFA